KSFSDDAVATIKSQKLELRDVKVTAADVPDHFVSAMKGHLKNELRMRGLLAGDGNSQAASIDMDVTYYRMRSGITRMMFGILAGKDGVEADIEISVHGTKDVLTKLTASSYNIMALGGPDDVARMFAEEVAKAIEKNLTGGNKKVALKK
ncbi:MAG: DUF4410 domain-containing protein, partial [Mariprofundaceae bacterium]